MKTLSRIMVFIMLKIGELLLLIYVPVGVGKLLLKWCGETGDFKCEWGAGIMAISGAILTVGLLSSLCLINWDWVKKIVK